MEKKVNKIALVGCGFVGASFIYAAINKGLAKEYVLIDKNEQVAEGNQWDFEDTMVWQSNQFHKIKKGEYKDCYNADIVVITAGRPSKQGETRLNMVKDNAKIMQEIIIEITKSGFKGIFLIASNPVDVLTYVALKTSNFPAHRVIGSGTSLDSSRLRFALAQQFNVAPQEVNAYIIGEHGDSSVAVYSNATIANESLQQLILDHNISDQTLATIHQTVVKKAYKIIEYKNATYYGIGSTLARIVEAIANDEKVILPLGCYLNNEYGQKDLYIGVPAKIGKNGIEEIIELKLSDSEQEKFDQSCQIIKAFNKTALDSIN